jgi:hypothetical protein
MFESLVMVSAFAIAGLAVRFHDWIWLQAIAAGLAAAGLIGAAFYNRQMAAETRRQVSIAEEALKRSEAEREQRTQEAQNALSRGELDSRQRWLEAEEARRVAQATLMESIKSRLDQLAPKVSVRCTGSVTFGAPEEKTLVKDVKTLDTYVRRSELVDCDLAALLRFTLLNHGSLPVSMTFGGDNPWKLTCGPKNGAGVLMPDRPFDITYVHRASYSEWEGLMAQGFGSVASEDDPWQLAYIFQVSDHTGQVVDDHRWRVRVQPFVSHGSQIQILVYPIDGPPTATVSRSYRGLMDMDQH